MSRLGLLAHLVSRFASDTGVIVDASSIHRFPTTIRSNKNLESIHQVNKQTLHHQSTTHMVIR